MLLLLFVFLVDEVEEKVEEVVEEPLTAQTAIQKVLQSALYCDGLARGLRESVKALDRNQAVLCVLSNKCDEPAYTKLVTALCKEAEPRIPVIKVEDSKVLGEWAGLCKYNEEGRPVNAVQCSCVVVQRWGEETPAYRFIKDLLAANPNL